MTLTPELQAKINAEFQAFQHETLAEDLIQLKAVKFALTPDALEVQITMPFAWQMGFEALKRALTEKLQALTNRLVTWSLQHNIATLKRANNCPPVNGVKNVIAVSSGKGGVGKSTLSVNLALALKAQGAKVGLLDADIYGPSVPHMLGASDKQPTSPDNKHILPIDVYGISSNSIGYLMKPNDPTIWRGPMASTALTQLLQETWWPDLDYLVVDLPPGTGDIQLTLSQQMPVTGAVVVTTPQDIALLDAIKGVAMFNKVGVPVLGVVENMSVHICSNCGHEEHIFGTGGAVKMAAQYQIDLLEQIPLHIRLREDLDNGMPTVVAAPTDPISERYIALAGKVAANLYWKGKVIPSEIMIREVK